METTHLAFQQAKLSQLLEQLIKLANESIPSENRKHGGYFTPRSLKTGRILISFPIGRIPINRYDEYLELSLKQGLELFNHKHFHTLRELHKPAHVIPGAIRGKECIYSFFGHDDEVNEALTIISFMFLEPSTPQNIKECLGLVKYYCGEMSPRNPYLKTFIHHAEKFSPTELMSEAMRVVQNW